MTAETLLDSYVGLLTFREIRRFLARSGGRMMAVFIGLIYGLFAMLEAGMLILQHYTPPYYVAVLWGSPVGYDPWNFPGLLVVAPWGVVQLPLFGTIAMVLVSAGVALGMSSAVLLAAALLRRRTAAGPTAVGSLSGLTPAMIGLVALGACCSTSAAATAGVGVIAGITGTSEANLLLNNWYLGIFQLAVVWVSLLAQEMLLRVYGQLFDPALGVGRPAPRPRWDRGALSAGALRVGLLVGGLAWILTAFEAWTTVNPATASVALWVDWGLLHLLPGTAAMVAALLPAAFGRMLTAVRPARATVGIRSLLLAAGIALLCGMPPLLAASGLVGLGNELLGVLGVAPGWGGVAPPVGGGPYLAFRWTLEYGLLGLFSIGVGIAPRAVADLLRRGSTRPLAAPATRDAVPTDGQLGEPA